MTVAPPLNPDPSSSPHETRTHLDADLIVIGFGKGGKTLAATLGRRGQRVVMIEESASMYGGTCINVGCVPTKSLIYQSETVHANHPDADSYRRAVIVERDLTSALRAENLAMLDSIDSVTVLTGKARFLDPRTVSVAIAEGESTVTCRADRIVIGTGARPLIPDIPGLRESPTLATSADLLTTPVLPPRLVILGGGYVGLEFAGMYAAYGSRVTVLERHSQILASEDDDVSAYVRDILRDNGVTIITDAEVSRVEDGPDSTATVFYEKGGDRLSVQADTVLAALGRQPATSDLGLNLAGVQLTASGAVAVDEYLRTTQPHIFATGDVNGGPQFTYISLDDYRIVLDQLTGTGKRRTTDRVAVPYTLFTSPPLARVGLTERDARAAGHP